MESTLSHSVSRAMDLAPNNEGVLQTAVRSETTHFQKNVGISSDWQISTHSRSGNISIKQRCYQGDISGRDPSQLLLPVLPGTQERGRGSPHCRPTDPQQLQYLTKFKFPMLTFSVLSLFVKVTGSPQSTCRAIMPAHRRFLRFVFQGTAYEYLTVSGVKIL